ncbi:MAG: helix-turn-helix domain-containing protein [Gaiellaceae bacterium]
MSAVTSERLLSSREVAASFGVSLETVQHWVRVGRLRAIRVGPHGRYRFRESDVGRLFASTEEAAA